MTLSVSVSATSDSTIEGTESFFAQLSNPSPSDRVTLEDPDTNVDILEAEREFLSVHGRLSLVTKLVSSSHGTHVGNAVQLNS